MMETGKACESEATAHIAIQTSIQKKKSTRKIQPYKRAEYPGQKLQADVMLVPSYCVSNGQKYYQYTAIDECTRVVFRELYDEHSTYSSVDFLKKLMTNFSFPIREIQTDKGTELTNSLLVKSSTHKSLFEEALDEQSIIYHRIRIATRRHNGKVERQHRTDAKRFYKKMKIYNPTRWQTPACDIQQEIKQHF